MTHNEHVKKDLEEAIVFVDSRGYGGVAHIMHDALELLKEQEAVKPILKREGPSKYYNDYVCPRCDNEAAYEQNYCIECGVRFLWEGR